MVKGKLESIKDKIESLNSEDSEKVKDLIKKQELSDKEIQELSEKISQGEIKEVIQELNVDGKKETLIPLEDYLKCAVHLGTKVITPHMRKFVYKRRADGIAVINTTLIDEKLRETIKFLLNYQPEQIYLLCKREAGWIPSKKFQETTGIEVFTKKYTPGVTTNLELEDFFEKELTIICDPWLDRNALRDTIRLKKPVISFCDTNNFITGITQIIPCNNKSQKSIGCILYILAREYCKAKKIPFKEKLEDFTGPLETGN